MRKIQPLLLLALTLTSGLRSASATPEYPAVIDAKLGVSCGEPSRRCLICHTTARGGQGTAEQPFVRGLKLTDGHRAALLISALDTLTGELLPRDSDDDGTPDLQELRECGNPSGDDLGSGPEYGCDGAQLAPRSPPSAALGAVALGFAALLVQRRGRRSRARADRSARCRIARSPR